MLSTNPAYKQAISIQGYSVYIPQEITAYHKSREVAAMAQHSYSESGITPDYLKAITDELLKCVNDDKNKNVRSDISILTNNIKYRLAYPVDEDCAIRMGAILSFIEYKDGKKVISEPTDKVEDFWTRKKVELAHLYPELYTFFLTWGVVNTPAYNNHSDISIDTDYFNKRRQALKALLPNIPILK